MTLYWPIMLIGFPMSNGVIQTLIGSSGAGCSSCKQLGVHVGLIARAVVVSKCVYLQL